MTSTVALSNATLPYLLTLAGKGLREALSADPGLAHGLNLSRGKVTHPAVAAWLGASLTPWKDAL